MAKISTLVDAFGSINGAVWDSLGSTGYSITSVDGAAKLLYSTVAWDYAMLRSVSTFDFIGSSATVEISDPGPMVAASSARMSVYADDNNRLDWSISFGGNINVQVYTGGVQVYNGDSIAYNSTDHRWLRIRESSGAIYFEASPDGVTNWVGYNTTTPAWISSAKLALTTQRGGSAGAGTSYASFDNLNVSPLPKIETLVDGFGTIDNGVWWSTGSTGYSITSMGGAAKLSYSTVAWDFAMLFSIDSFDFTESSATVEISDPGPMVAASSARMSVYVDDNNRLDWGIAFGGNINTQVYTAASQVYNGDTIAYNSTNHRWLRIRETGGTIYFEASPDGATNWVGYNTATPAWINSAKLYLTAQRGGSDGVSSSYTSFDNLNLPAAASSLYVRSSSSWVLSPGAKIRSGSNWVAAQDPGLL